jgi:hypothetical protein
MKSKILFISISSLILLSCKSPVEKAQTIINEKTDGKIGKQIVFFSSIIDFYYYANPVNYWYPEEYTYRDILIDKFRQGYKGLTKLDERVNSIQTNDEAINIAIKKLKMEISIAQKAIKKKQSSIEYLNSVSYGGLSGMLDMNNALSTPEERQETDETNRAMPSNVKDAFYDLFDLLDKSIQGLDTSMYNFEKEVFDISKPEQDEKALIRTNYKVFITQNIKLNFKSADTISRDDMIKELFLRYDTTFTLK